MLSRMKNRFFQIIVLVLLTLLSSCKGLKEHIREAREQGKQQNETGFIVSFNDEDAAVKPSGQKKTGKQKVDKSAHKTEDYIYFEKKWKITLSGNEDLTLLKEIDTWIGTPYKYGGNTKEGTDCSGMVLAIWKKLYQLDIKRSAYELWQQSAAVKRDNLQCGDFVFFKINRNQISHVGIFIASGYFVHSSSSRGVVIDHLDTKYFSERFASGGRIKR
jgi:hypothetical protein